MSAAKPTVLKLLEGNPGKRAINKKEPKAKVQVLPAPKHLSAWSKSRFNYWAKLLAQHKISTALDAGALTKLVEAEEEYNEYSIVIAEHGVTQLTTNTNGDPVVKPNPAVPARADAWRRIKMMYEQFGLTPSSRTKISAEEQQDENDPLQKYGV